MSEAGYTLAETLAAMAVLSLSVGSLSLGLQVLGPSQHAVGSTAARTQTARSMQTRVERLLALGAPFGSQAPEKLSGDATAFRFDCGAPQPCRVELEAGVKSGRLLIFDGRALRAALPLPAAEPARFRYRGAAAESAVWPPLEPNQQALHAISLLQGAPGGEVAVLQTKIWSEQAASCAFDPVMQACR